MIYLIKFRDNKKLSKIPFKNRLGFTLIELLVVVAIIGLLFSVVLVSTQGVREKAKIAKSLEFNSSIQRALGSEAMGIWSFDGDSANTARDASGSGNDGTVIGGGIWSPSDTPHKIVGGGSGRQSLFLDGGNDYVDVGGGSFFHFANAPLTIEAWIKPNSSTADTVVAKNCGSFSPRWTFDKMPDNRLRFSSSNLSPTEAFSTGTINPGNWNHVVMVWDGSTTAFYINASPSGNPVMTGTQSTCNYSLTLGAYLIGALINSPFGGYLDEVRIYKKILSAMEIQQRYAQGLEQYKNLSIK